MTRNVLITGGNSGIGYEMALALASRGDRVLIASRDVEKSRAAAARIVATQPNAQVEVLALDLGSFADIDRCASEVLARAPVLDALLLNAGLYTLKLHTLPNGVRVICDPMPGLQSAALSVVVHGGARWEPAERNGWSHLLEHMVFKGAGARSAREIVEKSMKIAAEICIYTNSNIAVEEL